MADIKDLIKKDLEVDFSPKLQGLNKNFGIAAGGGDNSNKLKPSIKPQVSQKVDAPAKPKTSMPKPTPTTTKIKPTAPTTPKTPKAGEMEKEEDKSIGKNEEIVNEVMQGYMPRFLGNVGDLAKSNPILALSALPYSSLSKAGTEHIIVGVHPPTKAGPSPKSKKLDDIEDEGSGGDANELNTKKDEIPANKVIKPKTKEELEKQGLAMDPKGAAALKNTFGGGSQKQAQAPAAAPKQAEPKKDTTGGLSGMLTRNLTKLKNNFANGK